MLFSSNEMTLKTMKKKDEIVVSFYLCFSVLRFAHVWPNVKLSLNICNPNQLKAGHANAARSIGAGLLLQHAWVKSHHYVGFF